MDDLRVQLQQAVAGVYDIERELGGGGMSRVFSARDVSLDREVVIKVLPPEVTARVQVQRFKREIQIAARLQHPHIVPLLAAGSSGDLLYYVMPFVEGSSLRQRLREARPSMLEALSILRDVADALSYSHKHGVVHRDVKPDNIMLQSSHALVVDFGVAKAISESTSESDLTSTGLTLGTPMYIAPEQALADGVVDGRADIYSLGVVAYEIFSGSTPFSAASPQAMMAAHITRAPEPLGKRVPGIRRDVAGVVMRCLEKDPDARWQTADELCEALNEIGARFTPSTRSGPLPVIGAAATAVVTDRRRRSVHTSTTVLIGILFIVAAVAAYVFQNSRAKATIEPSVAVLPFRNLDESDSSNYLAEGIAQELRSALSRVDGLEVASGTSSSALSQKGLDVREIGRRLQVFNVLEGTYTRSRDRLVVSAQLSSVATGYQTWSGRYDDKSTNISTVQSKIALAIANALGASLVSNANATRKPNPAAVDLVLRGRYIESDFEKESIENAIELYKRAQLIDSLYAPAYTAVADAYYHLADDYLPPREAYPKVKEAALRAASLDSTSSHSYEALASYEVSYGWDWNLTAVNLQRALNQDPKSSFGHMINAWYELIIGDTEKAVSEATFAASLDPYSFEIGGNVVSVLRAAGRHDLALSQIKRMLEDGTGDVAVLKAWMMWEYTQLGNLALAKSMMDSAVKDNPNCCKRTRAMILAHLGETDSSRKLLAAVESERRHRYYRAEFLAEARAALGDTAKAFEWLETAYRERSSGFPYFRWNSELMKFKLDPRFAALVARLNLPAEKYR